MSTWSRVSSCLTQCLCLAEVTRYYLYCSQSASSPFQQVRPAQPSPHPAPSPLGGQLAPSGPQAPALTNKVAVAGCSLLLWGPLQGTVLSVSVHAHPSPWILVTMQRLCSRSGLGPKILHFSQAPLPGKAVPAGHLE